MLETMKSAILDFQETDIETGISPRLQIETVHGKLLAVTESAK
jgi:hypothetical protein